MSAVTGATNFFAVTFTNIDGFSQFFVQNFARECRSHWHKNLLPRVRYVATIPCESLRHKSNTFHTNVSTLHVFISITFTETSIGETNKTQQKVRGSKFMFKMSCAIAAAVTVCMVQQPPLPQQMFFQLLHIMDPRAVDPLLKHIPDAVVHRIRIWRIRWPHLWTDKLWRLSLQHGDSVTCTMCRCPILLKKVVIPENRANLRQKHI